jgi:hypothetical protein
MVIGRGRALSEPVGAKKSERIKILKQVIFRGKMFLQNVGKLLPDYIKMFLQNVGKLLPDYIMPSCHCENMTSQFSKVCYTQYKFHLQWWAFRLWFSWL